MQWFGEFKRRKMNQIDLNFPTLTQQQKTNIKNQKKVGTYTLEKETLKPIFCQEVKTQWHSPQMYPPIATQPWTLCFATTDAFLLFWFLMENKNTDYQKKVYKKWYCYVSLLNELSH
jgi:hypothetical protein